MENDLTFRDFLAALTELVDGKKKEEKTYYSIEDIMARYDCSRPVAEKYVREAKALSCAPGGKLGKGKLLPSELTLWENYINGKDFRAGGAR